MWSEFWSWLHSSCLRIIIFEREKKQSKWERIWPNSFLTVRFTLTPAEPAEDNRDCIDSTVCIDCLQPFEPQLLAVDFPDIHLGMLLETALKVHEKGADPTVPWLSATSKIQAEPARVQSITYLNNKQAEPAKNQDPSWTSCGTKDNLLSFVSYLRVPEFVYHHHKQE